MQIDKKKVAAVVVLVVVKADHMLALRLNRANRQWDNYWNQVRQAA